MASIAIRWRWGLMLIAAVLALAAQLRPVLVYHLTVAPDLAERGFADRLEARTLDRFEAPPEDWPRLRVANLELSAPIARLEQGDPCRVCEQQCRIPITGGNLAIFRDPPNESLAEAFDELAPSASDIQPWRSRRRNWATLVALATRAQSSRVPEIFRFRAPGSQGVVTVHNRADAERFVVYAYGAEGTPTRVIGFVSVSREMLHAVLGSLVVADGPLEARSGDVGARSLCEFPSHCRRDL